MTNKDLTWNELAEDYDACHANPKARHLPTGVVFKWAEMQEQRYEVTKTGTVRYKENKVDLSK